MWRPWCDVKFCSSMRGKNVDKCSNLSSFLSLLPFSFSTPSTLIYTTLENEKERKKERKKKKGRKGRRNVCSATAYTFKATFICTSHAPTRTKIVSLCGTVPPVSFYLQLFTCRIQFQARISTKSSKLGPRGGGGGGGGGRMLALPSCVTWHEKTHCSPPSTVTNKGGHISSPLFPLAT